MGEAGRTVKTPQAVIPRVNEGPPIFCLCSFGPQKHALHCLPQQRFANSTTAIGYFITIFSGSGQISAVSSGILRGLHAETSSPFGGEGWGEGDILGDLWDVVDYIKK